MSRHKEITDGRVVVLNKEQELRLCFKLPSRYGVPRCIPYRKFIPNNNEKRPGKPCLLVRNGSLSAVLTYLLWELQFGLVDFYADERTDGFGQSYLFFSFVFRHTTSPMIDYKVYPFLTHLLGRVWRYIQPWENPDNTVCIVSSDRLKRRLPERHIVIFNEEDLARFTDVAPPDNVSGEKPVFIRAS